ncbi:DUF1345 domain-containing protein [Bryobacter aggregatus]|uniref:DUF1345 domain-containing protein n=1 Tax=Bryobacter aggregatus TaxID=360054 RepID=UPI0004E102D8|nr:DUF1345 domain-containing protein [Bryobacter aggregatus]
MLAHEPRWPVLLALISCGGLNLLLPDSISAGPGWVVVALAATLGVGSMMTADHNGKLHLFFAYGTQSVVTIALGAAVASLLHDILTRQGKAQDLLQSAVAIWFMNILVFATWYWRLDAGGPSRRRRHHSYREGAFLFPQATLSKEIKENLNIGNWHPQFMDYLFVSFTASTAFSPTDCPVLSRWAKVLMMLQSLIALASVALVAARAVNIL